MWEEIIRKQQKEIDEKMSQLNKMNIAGKISESTYQKEWIKLGILLDKNIKTVEQSLEME